LARLGRYDEAREAFGRAIERTSNAQERIHLEQRRDATALDM
jgi:predicted RNA polymerase sigma factor